MFLIVLINLYRIIFLYVFSEQLVAVNWQEIVNCLWLGFRLSLKTAGLLALIGFVFSALPQILIGKWPARVISKSFAYFSVFILTFGVFTRVPYYKLYNSTFNSTLLNVLHDDVWAIFQTVVNEYNFYPALIAVLVITVGLCKILNRILAIEYWQYKVKNSKEILRASIFLLCFLPVFCVLVRFGGGYSYRTGIHWENAGRLSAHILNEAILDDGQAMYRVWFAYKRINKAHKISFTKQDLEKSIDVLGGNRRAKTIDEALKRTVDRQMLSVQPQNVILILGENYAAWPFLDEYKDIGLVDECKKLLNTDKVAYTFNFLSQGSETVMATNALLTGLDNLFLHENYQPTSYREKYSGGIGTIMKNLGYKTYFWYGGFSGWQDVEKFTKAQSFDHFRAADSYPYSEGNVWGAADEYLFTAVRKHIEQYKEEKAFHFVLTMSNHPPFTLDVESKGFKKEKVKNGLPDSIINDEKILNHLGHIWYADKTMCDFIRQVETIKPDTLFTIVGDHAERFSFAKAATRQELSAVPCIFYGKGVQKSWFRHNQVGAHMQLPGTLAEVLGKPGDTYTAIMPNMFNNKNNIAVNNYLYVQDNKFDGIGNSNKQVKELSGSTKRVSAWRVLKGNEMN